MVKRSRPARSHAPRATVQVAALAAALLAYLLLPALHAAHHLAEHRQGAPGMVDVSAGTGCGHHACHTGASPRDGGPGEAETPGEEQEPGESRHDHSTCSTCLAIHAARKGVELPGTSPAVAEGGRHPEAPIALHRTAILKRELGPRSSRGPPLAA